MIPVFIDKSEGNENWQTVRFYYFVLTFQESAFQDPNIKIGSSLTGSSSFSGLVSALPLVWLESNHRLIVTGPLDGKIGERFSNVKQIDDLFDWIEDNDLEIDAVFHSFENITEISNLIIRRGEIYRINDGLITSFDSRSGKPTSIHIENMHPSPEETEVFSDWNKHVVEGVKKRYREQPEKTLRQRVKGGGEQ